MQNPAAVFEPAFQANPHDFAVVVRAMSQLVTSGREDLLDPWLERAQALEPQRWETVYHQALAHELAGRFTDAITSWRLLHTIAPQVDPHELGLARSLLAHLEFEQSLAICERALAALGGDSALISPLIDRRVYMHQFHIVISEIFLRIGDIRGCAYLLAQTQIRCPSYVIPNIPFWNSHALANKHLIITSAGGYGDQFMFASVLPLLRSLDCRITLTVHPDLFDFFVEALPDVSVIAEAMPTTLHEPASMQLQPRLAADPPDFQATMLHLPLIRAFTRAQSRFAFPAYLKVPERARRDAGPGIAALRKTAHGRQLVGLSWDRLQRHYPEITGAVEAARTGRSSLPAELLNDITGAPHLAEHFHFVALHEFDQHRAWPSPMPDNLSVTNIQGGDFAHTAAIIEACSFVLSVDMSVANLSAMLGKETWIMLAREGDWRWGIAEQSPWIDVARIFRQPKSGDWNSVVSNVTAALSANVAVPA